MPTPKKGTKKSSDNPMAETGIRVGKALARSTFKAEEAKRKAQQTAHKIITTATKKKAKESPLKSKSGLPVEAQLGFVAGDVYDYLAKNGTTPVDKLVNAMKLRKNSAAIVYGAIGWLAREDRLAFSSEGAEVSLK